MASKSSKKKPNSKRSNSKPAYSPMASPKHFHLKRFFILISIMLPVCVIVVLGVSSNTSYKISSDHHSVKIYGFELVNEFPHDPRAFTQGLVYAGNESLYESTGLYKQSTVRRVAIQTGKVEVLHKMPDSFFGEGLTLLGERLVRSNSAVRIWLHCFSKTVISFLLFLPLLPAMFSPLSTSIKAFEMCCLFGFFEV